MKIDSSVPAVQPPSEDVLRAIYLLRELGGVPRSSEEGLKALTLPAREALTPRPEAEAPKDAANS